MKIISFKGGFMAASVYMLNKYEYGCTYFVGTETQPKSINVFIKTIGEGGE